MATERKIGGKHYVWALIALLLLTASSWGLAHLDLGAFNPVVALGIAVIKATTVLFIFMHLAEHGFVMRLVVLVAIIFIALLCLGIISDVAYR